jgi:hypothetical protein
MDASLFLHPSVSYIVSMDARLFQYERVSLAPILTIYLSSSQQLDC